MYSGRCVERVESGGCGGRAARRADIPPQPRARARAPSASAHPHPHPHPLLRCPQPVDKLQTNNKGTFLLQDLNFRWARYVSGGAGDEPGAVALQFSVFCCGLVRGALAAFDLNMVVHVDVSALPKAVFQVRAVE